MSQWHRDNPELAGTDADPWMRHADYRRALPHAEPGAGQVDVEREADDELDGPVGEER